MRTFLITLCLLTAPLALAAPEEPQKVPLALFCFHYAPGLQEVFVRVGEDSYRGVKLSNANMIGPINAAVIKGQVTIHREVRSPVGRRSWPIVAQARVQSIDEPLLVLVPGDVEDRHAYRSFVIDRAAHSFPMGSYQLINFSPHAVRGTVGDRSRLAAPGSMHNLRPAAVPGTMMPVEFTFRDGDRWRRMTTTRWAYRLDRRSLLCIYLDPTDDRMKLRSIPERLMAPPTATR